MENPSPEVKSKAELFAENPDRFIDINDIVIATQMTEKGLAVAINMRFSRGDIARSLGELQIEVMRKIIYNDAAKASTIVPPGGIMNFARRFKK